MCIRDSPRTRHPEHASAQGMAGRRDVAGAVDLARCERRGPQARRAADRRPAPRPGRGPHCLLYTSDAADERSSVDLGGRRIIKKKKKGKTNRSQKKKKMEIVSQKTANTKIIE